MMQISNEGERKEAAQRTATAQQPVARTSVLSQSIHSRPVQPLSPAGEGALLLLQKASQSEREKFETEMAEKLQQLRSQVPTSTPELQEQIQFLRFNKRITQLEKMAKGFQVREQARSIKSLLKIAALTASISGLFIWSYKNQSQKPSGQTSYFSQSLDTFQKAANIKQTYDAMNPIEYFPPSAYEEMEFMFDSPALPVRPTAPVFEQQVAQNVLPTIIQQTPSHNPEPDG